MNNPAEIKSGVSGRFKIELQDGDAEGKPIPGTKRIAADWFSNLITNGGLDALAYRGFMDFVQVGAGSNVAAFTDTALQSRIAGKSGSMSQGTAGSGYSSVIGTYVFAQGAAAGNLSELGVSTAVSGALTSRALILDGGGAPTTITVASIAILTVTYEFRVYVSQTDITGSMTIGGVATTTVSRAARLTNAVAYNAAAYAGLGRGAIAGGYAAGSYTGALGAVTSVPSGKFSNSGTPTESTYIAGNHYEETTWFFNINQGNGSVAAFCDYGASASFVGAYGIQTSFDPPIAKDDTKTLSFTQRRSWGRM